MTSRAILILAAFIVTAFGSDETAIKSFDDLAKGLPPASVFKSSGKPYTITPGKFDVKKSNSLVNPIVGAIPCAVTMADPAGDEITLELQLEFMWVKGEGKWKFERLINRKTRKDITALPLGQDMLTAGPLRDFLRLHGL